MPAGQVAGFSLHVRSLPAFAIVGVGMSRFCSTFPAIVMGVIAHPNERVLIAADPPGFIGVIRAIDENLYASGGTTSDDLFSAIDLRMNSYDGTYDPLTRNHYAGQGNDGWRNFKRCLAMVARLEYVAPVRTISLPPARLYNYRSDPRWKRRRWKAKT